MFVHIITFCLVLQTGIGETRLTQKYAFIKKSTILSKFRNDWVKNVDFLIKAYFWVSPVSPIPVCIATVYFINLDQLLEKNRLAYFELSLF